ncbi:hypothetical protein GCM10018771_01340 [Streptomyces cellulosae]|nr:hypothetical protein GCM10018771_01340 [Streptomyces cellulosae]
MPHGRGSNGPYAALQMVWCAGAAAARPVAQAAVLQQAAPPLEPFLERRPATARRVAAAPSTRPEGYTHVSSHIRDRQSSIGIGVPV